MTSVSNVSYQPLAFDDHTDYLIDTNCLLIAYNDCYRPTFGFSEQSFWIPLEELVFQGVVGVIDKVWQETYGGKDNDDRLNRWLDDIHARCIGTEYDGAIVRKYGEVLNALSSDVHPQLFAKGAQIDWASNEVADPWLIATAVCRGARIITFEKYKKITTPGKHPKIPTVAKLFGIECLSLYDFMEEQRF